MAGEYKVTLSIYSGRPDPSWTIHSSHEHFKKIKEHQDRRAAAGKAPYHPRQMASKLGYRGFVLHHQDTEHPELIVGQETVSLQQLLLDTMPKEMKTDAFHQKVLQMIADPRAPPAPAPPGPEDVTTVASQTKTKPVLNLGKWNNDYSVQENNNCYNYGNDQISGTFAQPGKASGHPITYISGQQVQAAAVFDGLHVLVPQPGPHEPPVNAPDGQWLVALVVAPGPLSDPHADYHWYRLDTNGLWSHKPGRTPATRYDGNGDLIADPRHAANSGIDYKFYSFMTTDFKVIQ